MNTIYTIVYCRGQVQDNPASSCREVSKCNPQLPSEYYWITSPNGTAVQVYCDMTRECSCSSASVGGWSRVAYLNMTDPIHQCPPAWREITEPVRTCGRTNETVPRSDNPDRLGGCSSVSFSTYNISFSHICGRIIGYQVGSPEAFLANTNSWYTRIEDPYVDGVVITHGTEIEHVWTFAASFSENRRVGDVCPCTNAQSTQSIPSFVGQDYFCEAGITSGNSEGVFYPDGDPLWDGEGCGSGSTCCELHDPPYFCKSLTEPATGDIEVRICANEQISRADTPPPLELVEIFVQ